MIERRNTVVIFSGVVFVAGLVAITGWFFDIVTFEGVFPMFLTMKFTTAIAFLFSALILFFSYQATLGIKDLSQVAISFSSMVIFLLMTTLLVSVYFEIDIGIDNVLVKEGETVVLASTPDQTSIASIANFILIGLAGVIAMAKTIQSQPILQVFGSIITGIGAIAVFGYIFGVSELYYSIDGVSSAMEIDTALLFMVIGWGFVVIGWEKGPKISDTAEEPSSEEMIREQLKDVGL